MRTSSADPAPTSLGEDCFAHGKHFIPERWTTSPELLHNASAFNPFAIGESHLICARQLFTDSMLQNGYMAGTNQ